MTASEIKDPLERLTEDELIAQEIMAISEGVKRLLAGRLNDKAIILLIQHASPSMARGKRVGVAEIRAVLEGIGAMEETYLKKGGNNDG